MAAVAIGRRAPGRITALAAAILVTTGACAPAPAPSAAASPAIQQPPATAQATPAAAHVSPTPRGTPVPPPAAPGIDAQTVSAGSGTTCRIRDDGSVACWGTGVSNPPAGAFRGISEDGGAGCAIRTDGTLECWTTPEEDAEFGEEN